MKYGESAELGQLISEQKKKLCPFTNNSNSLTFTCSCLSAVRLITLLHFFAHCVTNSSSISVSGSTPASRSATAPASAAASKSSSSAAAAEEEEGPWLAKRSSWDAGSSLNHSPFFGWPLTCWDIYIWRTLAQFGVPFIPLVSWAVNHSKFAEAVVASLTLWDSHSGIIANSTYLCSIQESTWAIQRGYLAHLWSFCGTIRTTGMNL